MTGPARTQTDVPPGRTTMWSRIFVLATWIALAVVFVIAVRT
jgi:hypothetical protein